MIRSLEFSAPLPLLFFLNFFYVYLFLRERQGMGGEGQREGDTQNLKQAPGNTEPDAGLELTNCEIMT